jgi:hypothetical protein
MWRRRFREDLYTSVIYRPSGPGGWSPFFNLWIWFIQKIHIRALSLIGLIWWVCLEDVYQVCPRGHFDIRQVYVGVPIFSFDNDCIPNHVQILIWHLLMFINDSGTSLLLMWLCYLTMCCKSWGAHCLDRQLFTIYLSHWMLSCYLRVLNVDE